LTKRYPQLESDGWLTDLADVEAEFLRPDGSSVPVLLSATAVSPHGTDPALARYTVFDITWRKRNEAQVVYQASHDALTGLPNRTLLHERATQALNEAARNETAVALMFLDLDHFKQINDTLGHQVGDQLLVEASRRITHCVRKHDTVARIGGDEFVLVLPMAAADPQIHGIAQKIVAALAQPFQISGHTLRVSASVGVSLYPQQASALDQLMEQADAAMYVIKKRGRNGYHIHQSVTDT
jgi:diguanylate cyclase (GGDEF)-like protein